MIERARFETLTAVRSLLATPGPALAAIATLAIAAGVNLAMFGLIDRALLSPPAFVTDAGRVFTLSFQASDDPARGRMTTTSYVTYAAIRDQVPAFSGAAAFQRNSTSVVVEGEQRRANAMLVSGRYFDVLGVGPRLGPGIHAADDDRGAAPAAVLSHAFWRAAFGGRPDVIGRRLFMRGIEYSVAGVMPAGFSGHASTDVDLWVPFAAAMRDSPGWDRDAFRNILSVVVRLAPGVAPEAAEAQSGAALGRRVRLAAIAGAGVAATEERVAWWLAGVSVLVFVTGLANAGTLLVVRATRRRRDLAIRAAIGASRERLIVQALVEAGLVSLSATALSLALVPWLDDVVCRVLFPGLVASRGVGMRTVATAIVAGALALVVAAIANLWHLPRATAALDLAAAGRGGPRRTRTLTGLLLIQTTLSVVLLAGAAMFGTSFYQLAAQDFGMRMDGVVVAEFELGPGSPPGQGRLFADAIDQVRALPHVQLVSVIDAIPFGGFNVPPISVPGRPRPNVGGQLPHLIAATPELFRILEIEVVEGRSFTEADGRGAPVVIVNQAMARGVWPGESALGKCIRIGFDPDFDPATAAGPPTPSDKVPCREVVGVTRDVRQRSVLPVDNEARLMQYFVPFSQVPSPPFAPQSGSPVRGLLIRTDASAETLAPAIRRLIVGQRTDLAFLNVQPYVQLLDRQMRPWQLGTTLLVLFSALAVAVAAVGLYAAFAHAVAERRREMAIRLAVGARPGQVTGMVLREALVLAGAGVICGLAAAVLAGRGVQSLLFGTTPSDPLVLLSAAMVMLLVAAAATLRPARAAARADPNTLLRVN